MCALRMYAIAIVTFAAVAGVGCAHAADLLASTVPSEVLLPADWKPLHQKWEAAMKEFRLPGMAVAVVRGGETVLLDVLGVCDPDSRQKVMPQSPFYLASVTKSFTAMGIAVLVDEGRVKLDAPVQEYLPRFTLANPEAAKSVTIRDLLAHRRGLDSQAISMAEAYSGTITEERYYRLLARVRPLEKFQYSNLHYTLLGRVIEAVSGQRWQDFLAERVFKPLAMKSSTCYASQLYANPLAARPMENTVESWSLASQIKVDAIMHAAGGMGASAVDMTHWLALHLTGMTPEGMPFVRDELLREVHARQVEIDEPEDELLGLKRDGYSLGWFTGACEGHRVVEHGGGYVGTATEVCLFPDDQLGIAVMLNDGRGLLGWQVILDVCAKLLGTSDKDLLPAIREREARFRLRLAERDEAVWEAPSATTGLSEPLAKYVGKYQNELWGDLDVVAQGTTLALRFGLLDARLQTLAPNKFRYQLQGNQAFAAEFKLDAKRQVSAILAHTPLGRLEFKKVP